MTKVDSKHAGFLIRAAATIVDGWVLVIIFVPVYLIFGRETYESVSYLIVWLYSILAIRLYGKTIGKAFFGLKVINYQGQRPSWWKAIVRETIGKIISIVVLYLGVLWVIWDKDKQAWHDKLAKTYVVIEKPVAGWKKKFMIILVLSPIILGILATLILVAINPAARLSQ